ncbi:hypothetical protein [Vibrio sp. E150_018]
MTLISVVLSSVSVATPISMAQMSSDINYSEQAKSGEQQHSSPCSSMIKTSLTTDYPCSDSTQHSNDHCASCTTIYATLPTALGIESNPSAASGYNDHTESIPSLTLPNLSRPPIQSVWL